jgi:hypothetical protein
LGDYAAAPLTSGGGAQEVTGREAEDEGRIPRTVEAELREELVGAAAVGDVVQVLGFVKVLHADAAAGEGTLAGGRRWRLMALCLHALQLSRTHGTPSTERAGLCHLPQVMALCRSKDQG